MPGVHEQNLRNAERALGNLRANTASGMPQDEVLLRLDVECEAVDFEAYASYASEPVGTHPEVEVVRYSSAIMKAFAAKGHARDYLDGRISADEALASISKRLGLPLDRREDGDPSPRDDEGEARPGPSPASPKGAVPPADELIRKYSRQFRESMNVASFLLEIGKVEDPKGVEALENVRRACGRMIAFLDDQAAISEGLDAEEAKLELAMISDKVVVEFAYVGIMLKVAMQYMPKEAGGKGPTQTSSRDSEGRIAGSTGQSTQPPNTRSPRQPTYTARYVPPPPRRPPLTEDQKLGRALLWICGSGVLLWFLLYGCLSSMAA